MRSLERLEKKVDEIESIAWSRLFHPRTNLFYDFVSAYEEADRFNHLPSTAEIARLEPNPNGWGTGMEDSVINGGVMLAAYCDRYDATRDDSLQKGASLIFDGLVKCASIAGVDGFVARSISLFDGKSYYVETSRDQITHFVHGLWKFHRSSLATEEQRKIIRALLTALCQRLEKRITRENDFHFGRADGRNDGLVDKMWEVAPHEVFRLPMAYAACWDVSGDEHWRELYEKYLRGALETATLGSRAEYSCAYALFQHQASMELLYEIEKDAGSRQSALRRLMVKNAENIDGHALKFDDYKHVDVGSIDMDWRTRPSRPAYLEAGYGHVPEWPPEMYNHSFTPVRGASEALLTWMMAPGGNLPEERVLLLERIINDVDYNLQFTYAMLYPIACYWRFRKSQSADSTYSVE